MLSNLNNPASPATDSIALMATPSVLAAVLTPTMLSEEPGSGYPDRLVDLNGTLIYIFDDGVHGPELWRSDGTPETTRMIVDAVPGVDGLLGGFANVFPIALGNQVLFLGRDAAHGIELWKTDGTAAGTQMVKDIRRGTSASNILFSTVGVSRPILNGYFYFSADDGTNGSELWRTDGTAAGTTMVKDINTFGLGNASPSWFVNVNGTLFFSAYDGVHGNELWKSDGTAAGTVLVKDIRSGMDDSRPLQLTNVNGTLVFTADDGINGRELWKSDGTEQGTTLLKDIYPGATEGRPHSSLPSQFYLFQGKVVLDANDQAGSAIWVTDGTLDGTQILTRTGFRFNSLGFPSGGDYLYFGAESSVGDEVWRTDLTAAGTAPFADIFPGTGSSEPSNFTNFNGLTYFKANDGTHGHEIFVTDGTLDGTRLFAEINPGTGHGAYGYFRVVGNVLYFIGSDGVHDTELWAFTEATPTFAATATPIASGVTTEFRFDLDSTALNLFSTSPGGAGVNDVTLVGAATGPVAGSLVAGSDSRTVTFIKTGGLLVPDTYTLTLRSAADGFKDSAGNLLDGDDDGTAGDNLVHSFTVAAPAAGTVTVSLPDFARGPGQPVDVPATGAGLPLTLSDADRVTRLTLEIAYDPALLNISSVAVPPGLPFGATASIDTTTPGIAKLSFASDTRLSAGATTLALLQADVPSGATYKASQILKLRAISINGEQISAVGDDALQVVSNFGDANGDRQYTGFDASRISRVVVGLDSGFSQFVKTDPAVIADINADGNLTGFDASRVSRVVVGLPVPQIPGPAASAATLGAEPASGGLVRAAIPSATLTGQTTLPGTSNVKVLADALSAKPRRVRAARDLAFARSFSPLTKCRLETVIDDLLKAKLGSDLLRA